MEFEGRVKKLLPVRSGTSQRTGNEWQALPFVFEYFENPSDRYADSVVLETFDTNVIQHLKEGMEIRCGFGHRTREFEGKTYNELRLYKIENIRKEAQQAQTMPTNGDPSVVTPPAAQPQNQEGGGNDNLPF